MKILLNGETADTSARSLEELCMTLGYQDAGVATALNGNFVRIDERRTTTLSENDKVEIVSPREGG